MLLDALWIILSYLAGATPFGLLIARTFCGLDPRQAGSRSIGATNVSRLCGLGFGVATLACDLLKGCLMVLGAQALGGGVLFVSATALACVFGHVWSCFLGFRGGKAVATSIGVFLPLAFWQLAASCALCCLVIWGSGYVSLGSLTLLFSLPLFLFFSGLVQWLPLALILLALVLVRHRENLARLASGTEKSWLKNRHKE